MSLFHIIKNKVLKSTDESLSDEILIDKVKRGEKQAFTTLVLRYDKLVQRIGWRFFIQSEDVQDFIQEVFIRAFENLSSFRFESKFSVWLYRIAYNHALNKVRSNRIIHEQWCIEDDNTYAMKELKGISFQTPEDSFEQKELTQTLFACLSKLPEHQRMALELFYLDELSLNEVADIMKLNLNTVKSHIHRGKAALKCLMQKHHKDFYHD